MQSPPYWLPITFSLKAMFMQSNPACHGSEREMVTYIFSFQRELVEQVLVNRPQQGGTVLSCGRRRLQTSKGLALLVNGMAHGKAVLAQTHTVQPLRCRN